MFFNFLLVSALICFLVAFIFWIFAKKYSMFDSSVLVPAILFIEAGGAFLFSPHANIRLTIICGLVLIWSVRIYLRLYPRLLGNKKAGSYASGAAMSFVLSLPLILTSVYGGPELGFVGYMAVALWVIGFTLEMVRDFALDKFQSDPNNKERFLTGGLFHYVRHPHYLGEILMWVALAILALPTTTLGPLSFLSPIYLLLYFVLLRIPEAEARLARLPEFRPYAERTPKLFPRFFSRV